MDNDERIDDLTAGIGEGILKVLIGGGMLSLALVAPNALQALDKPLRRYLSKLDARARNREMRRGLYYAKRRGWISSSSRGYEHGLQITEKGRSRLHEVDLDRLAIESPQSWDKKWRLVFYDIPEAYKSGRKALLYRMRTLGFYPLQRSVFVYPFPCRKEIEAITAAYGIEQYVSYIETDHIDQQQLLQKKFKGILNN